MTQAIALRATINELEGHRNRALDLFAFAFDQMCEALRAAHKCAPSNDYPISIRRDDLSYSTFDLGNRANFIETMRRKVDRTMWRHLLTHMGLETLMDATARREFEGDIEKSPPAANAENCFATMSGLVQDSDTIFRRGLVEAFCRLDRRFKSHDGFKIGSRIILSNAYPGGRWNYHGGRDAMLRDVERVFCVLDNKAPPTDRSGGIVGTIEAACPSPYHRVRFEAESDYFRARIFENGNVHIWFKRGDLVRKVNQLLAEYYGAALGADLKTAA